MIEWRRCKLGTSGSVVLCSQVHKSPISSQNGKCEFKSPSFLPSVLSLFIYFFRRFLSHTSQNNEDKLKVTISLQVICDRLNTGLRGYSSKEWPLPVYYLRYIVVTTLIVPKRIHTASFSFMVHVALRRGWSWLTINLHPL